MRQCLRVLLPGLFAIVFASSSAWASGAGILILNEGEEPIYSLALAQAGGDFGSDLLGPADVVEIGEGRWVRIPAGRGSCYYDMRASYRDGHTADRKRVNLCVTERIVFAH